MSPFISRHIFSALVLVGVLALLVFGVRALTFRDVEASAEYALPLKTTADVHRLAKVRALNWWLDEIAHNPDAAAREEEFRRWVVEDQEWSARILEMEKQETPVPSSGAK